MDLDARALANVDDVLLYDLSEEADDQQAEDWIIERLNTVSSLIHSKTHREIVASNAVRDAQTGVVTVAAAARMFDGDELEPDAFDREWCLPVGDLSARPTRIRVLERDGTLVEDWQGGAITAWNLVDVPRRRVEPWRPVAELRFTRSLTNSIAVSSDYLYEITGVWGFPQIPDFVKEAALLQVKLWQTKDVKHFSATFNREVGRVTLPRELDPIVERMVGRIKVAHFG